MYHLLPSGLFAFFLIGAVQGGIEERLRKDFFNIYKNIAIEARDIQNKPVTPDKVNFFLFTREKPNEFVRFDADNLEKFNNLTSKLVFLIHGWTNDREIEWFEDVKNAFLNRDEEFYVVQVDWKEPANQLYTGSSISTYDVAKIIANVIEDMHYNCSVPIDNIILVGHSLGAQICGFIGKRIFKTTGIKMPRIVALDPAGPLFSQRPEDKRLNKNDAKVVHVIHSDGGTFGYYSSCGTIDFYPNGGSSQPGCKRIDLFDVSSVQDPILCDHRRAWAYYSEAILNPNEFLAKKCSSWAKFKVNLCEKQEVGMGDLMTTAEGDYYLETNKERPYSKNRKAGFNILKILQH